MPTLNDAFGIHPTAVALRAQRAALLAGNLANADTPGYQARDIDFRAVLGAEGAALGMTRTNGAHLDPGARAAGAFPVHYRQPVLASLDQNGVDVQLERAQFLDNAMRYQASVTFLNGKITGLLTALRGE